MDEIMRGGLISDDVRRHSSPDEFGIDLRRVADQADRDRLARLLRAGDQRQRAVEVRRNLFEIADLLALARPFRIDLDAEDRRAGHPPGQGLRAAHTAKASREDEAAA